MEILTAQQMRHIDRRAVTTFGVPEIVLMENAGQAVFSFVRKRFRPLARRRILLLCGRGNNGGDGLVVARRLRAQGVPYEVVLFGRARQVGGSAGVSLEALRRAGVAPREVLTHRDWRAARRLLAGSDLVLDAILGTGLSRPVEGLLAEVFADINGASAEVVAVDIPSGLSGDTHEVPGPCIEADHTVTFVRPKVAHLVPPACTRVGALWVADIGIPAQAVARERVTLELLEAHALRDALPPRRRDSHKGSFGHALVVAGSRGKGGAARMTTLAALRSGCGLATAAIPASLQSAFVSKAMEAMTEPLPEDADGGIAAAAAPILLRAMRGKAAIAVGPGLGQGPGARAVTRAIVLRARVPVVLDADGLNAFAGGAPLRVGRGRTLVVTPHPGEMARLLGTTVAAVQADRIRIARTFARRHRCHVVLKGYRSLIATPEGKVFVNPTGNPGMAKGGSGDVLTGILAGLLAQGLEVDSAVTLGVYLHGLTGDLAVAGTGEVSLLARDLLAHLPRALQCLASVRNPDLGAVRRMA